jgi:hypothetical protein
MAEFYRLAGGKIGKIALAQARGVRRAHTRGVMDIEAVIVPGSRFDKEVLWHELAHHLEAGDG